MGTDESFAEFVAGRSGSLIARATLLTGDAEQARDIVQSVLTRVYPRWRAIRHEDPYGYVNRAVANAVLDWWRSAQRRHEVPTSAPPETARSDVDWADRQAVLAALRTLTPRERAVVVLRYLDDLTERQTADALRIGVGTVKSTCHTALRKLRVTLDDSPARAGGTS